MFRKIFLCFVLFIGAYKTFAQNDPVIATVNGEKITKSELDKEYLLNKYVVSNDPVTMKKVLTDMINKKIGIDRAKKNKLDKNEVVKQKMEEVLFHAQVSKDLEPKFQQISVTDKDVEDFCKITKLAIKDTERTLKIRCPLDSEYKVGTTWAETH